MSETERQEREALAEEARELRAKASVRQSDIAAKMGIPQTSVSSLERGKLSLDVTRAYVELLRTTPVNVLREKLSGEAPKTEEKPESAPAKPPPLETAIAREVKSFLRRHSMTIKDFSDICNVSKGYIGNVCRGYYAPSLSVTDKLRKAMKKYEGDNTPTSAQFKPADPVVQKPVAPAPPPAPKQPEIKLVVEEGKRINNGDNIAPLLRLDGKTMHVFTLVPGGVFVSYVAAEVG